MPGWRYAHCAPLICRQTNVDARYRPPQYRSWPKQKLDTSWVVGIDDRKLSNPEGWHHGVVTKADLHIFYLKSSTKKTQQSAIQFVTKERKREVKNNLTKYIALGRWVSAKFCVIFLSYVFFFLCSTFPCIQPTYDIIFFLELVLCVVC